MHAHTLSTKGTSMHCATFKGHTWLQFLSHKSKFCKCKLSYIAYLPLVWACVWWPAQRGWRWPGAEEVAGERSVGYSRLDCDARLYRAVEEAELAWNWCPWAPQRNAARQRHHFLRGAFLPRRSRDRRDSGPGINIYLLWTNVYYSTTVVTL